MCGIKFERMYVPRIDNVLQEAIKMAKPDEFDTKINELQQDLKDRDCFETVKFFYGNTHKMMQFDESSEKKSKTSHDHEWTAFIETTLRSQTQKYIEKVEFKLHPSFKHQEVAISSSPYEITRVGHQMFRLKITIHWKDWLETEPKVLYHMLNFESEGETHAFLLNINKAIINKRK